MKPVEHHVRIGQLLVAGEGEILKTVLGSCVGIALIWRKQSKCALAHCLLPEPSGPTGDVAARYVSETVPKLLEILGASSADIKDLEAVVCGGGQMMDVEKQYLKFVVGEENLRMAKKMLDKHRIRIVAYEPGGDQGSKLRVDCGTGQFEFDRIPKTG